MKTNDIAALDDLIAGLQSELDACPTRLWLSDGNQYRLAELIRLTARRAALAA